MTGGAALPAPAPLRVEGPSRLAFGASTAALVALASAGTALLVAHATAPAATGLPVPGAASQDGRGATAPVVVERVPGQPLRSSVLLPPAPPAVAVGPVALPLVAALEPVAAPRPAALPSAAVLPVVGLTSAAPLTAAPVPVVTLAPAVVRRPASSAPGSAAALSRPSAQADHRGDVQRRDENRALHRPAHPAGGKAKHHKPGHRRAR